MDKFKTVLNIAQKQQTSLGFSLVALLTAGGEQIFSTVVFQCPCSEWNFTYGMVFLLVPALALLGLGYILSNKTWKMFTGLCIRKSKCRLKNICAFGMVLFQITSSALVAPVSWIAVALLNGKYYECAITGMNITGFTHHSVCSGKDPMCQAELQKFPCGRSTVPQTDIAEVLSTIRAESQILGWLLIASIMLSSLLLTCVARCNSPVSYLQLKFWKAYAHQEGHLLDSFTEDHARKLAERNLNSFFRLEPPEALTTPPNQAWRKISNFYRFSTRDQFYSILHQYVETERSLADGGERKAQTGASIRSVGPDADTPAVLSFLEEGSMGL